MKPRYLIAIVHGEAGTVFNVVDSAAPEGEQPAVIRSWSSFIERQAEFLARDFCERHNAKDG